MDIGIIARRYARALLLFACENGHETLVYEQAQQLLFQYNQLPEFRHTIENPIACNKMDNNIMFLFLRVILNFLIVFL